MNRSRLRVTVSAGGDVRATRFGDRPGESKIGRLALDGLDSELLHHYERWLTLRDRDWLEDEISVFGRLLHRCLFPAKPYDVWSWIDQNIRESTNPLPISLEFPLGREHAHLSAIPWEYLYAPPAAGRQGYFLARHGRVVLSRFVPGPGGALPPEPSIRVLPVVANPSDGVLGPVISDEVEAELDRIGRNGRFSVAAVLRNPDDSELGARVIRERPHLVHFMGHGRFDSATGVGSLALRNPLPGAAHEWVDHRRIADQLCPGGHRPRVVVLHTCEGGRADTSFRFAGLAPELIQRGVQCVIAMQYPIRNDAAQEFSKALYAQLGEGRGLDEAVQGCRDRLSARMRRFPRLIGVPMLYQRRADPVLVDPPPAEDSTS